MSVEFSDYLDCLRLVSEETGNVKSFLGFNSGENDYIYNQVYSVADHFVGSDINIDRLPGLSMGETDWPITGEGYFAGEDLIRIGFTIPYSGWSMVMDISPDFCNYRDESNVSRVLMSTMDTVDSASGFHVGINQGNRLYIQYNSNQQARIRTLPNEINANSTVAVSQGRNNVSVYYNDLHSNSIHSLDLPKSELSHSDKLFVGGFNSNSNIEYTGYEGYIHSLVLLSGDFGGGNINNQCDCMFVEGINTNTTIVNESAEYVTGQTETPIYTTGVTGYETATTYLTQKNGSNIPIQYQSGVTGLIQIGTKITLLTGSGFTTGYNITTSGIDYDEEKQKLYSRYFLNFRNGLISGEKIEIHTFDNLRSDVGLIPGSGLSLQGDKVRLYYRGAFNQASGDKSYPTGLTSHEFDYFVYPTGGEIFLSGLPTGNPYITYDLIDTRSICIDFSGLWEETRFNMGVGSYVEWYPNRSQFLETGNNTITITGISGENGFVSVHDRDVYINGQKLIFGEDHGYITGVHTGDYCSNSQYSAQTNCEAAGTCSDSQYTTQNSCEGATPAETWTSETWTEFTGDALILFGEGLPGWGHPTTSFINQVNVPQDVFTAEICFVPRNTGEAPNIVTELIEINPSTTVNGISDPISGFSELVWLNGLRQQGYLEYRRGLECSLTNSFSIFEETPLVFYNNNTNLLNME